LKGLRFTCSAGWGDEGDGGDGGDGGDEGRMGEVREIGEKELLHLRYDW
jgi:hypothetical protein